MPKGPVSGIIPDAGFFFCHSQAMILKAARFSPQAENYTRRPPALTVGPGNDFICCADGGGLRNRQGTASPAQSQHDTIAGPHSKGQAIAPQWWLGFCLWLRI